MNLTSLKRGFTPGTFRPLHQAVLLFLKRIMRPITIRRRLSLLTHTKPHLPLGRHTESPRFKPCSLMRNFVAERLCLQMAAVAPRICFSRLKFYFPGATGNRILHQLLKFCVQSKNSNNPFHLYSPPLSETWVSSRTKTYLDPFPVNNPGNNIPSGASNESSSKSLTIGAISSSPIIGTTLPF